MRRAGGIETLAPVVRRWGMAFPTHAAHARRGFTLMEIMIVVFLIGLLATMALPAIQKARNLTQDKLVLNNTRQLAAAADQYFLEYGVNTVARSDLVGTDQYVKTLNIVAGEAYPDVFTQGVTITVSGIAGVRTLTYAP